MKNAKFGRIIFMFVLVAVISFAEQVQASGLITYEVRLALATPVGHITVEKNDAGVINDVAQVVDLHLGSPTRPGDLPEFLLSNLVSINIEYNPITFAPAQGTIGGAMSASLFNPNRSDSLQFFTNNDYFYTSSDGIRRIGTYGIFFSSFDPGLVNVNIDIKPGSEPNCFNNNGHGVIPVAILGNINFDVAEINAKTVALEGLRVKTGGKNGKLLAHIEDTNYDGFNDLVVQIEDNDSVFEIGDDTATLTALLFDNTPIKGTDSICVVP